MSYFVGLDVSLRSVALCVVDADGDIVLERTLDCEVEAIDGYLRKFGEPIAKLGFEAGVMSQMLFHGLQALGYDVVCMEARQVSAALSAMRNKTDKNDARGIAQVVRTGWYQPVHMKSRESHYIRAMLSSRKAVLRKCVDLENEIRGLFKTFGIRLPSTLAHHRFDNTVRPIIEADEGLAFALTPMLEAHGALYAHYREMDKTRLFSKLNVENCHGKRGRYLALGLTAISEYQPCSISVSCQSRHVRCFYVQGARRIVFHPCWQIYENLQGVRA